MIFKKKLRYILVESTEKARFNEIAVSDAIKKNMLSFLGQLPYFKANPQIVAQFSEMVFVMSVNRGYERNAVLSLSFIKNLNGKRVGFCTIRISGTIRSLRAAYRKIYS